MNHFSALRVVALATATILTLLPAPIGEAQTLAPFRMPTLDDPRTPVGVSRTDQRVDRLANGDLIVGVGVYGMMDVAGHRVWAEMSRGGVALARLSPSGQVRWLHTYEGARGAALVHLTRAPDGGFVVYGRLPRAGDPSSERMALIRFDDEGRERWRLTTVADASETYLEPHFAPDGRLLVSGSFTRGTTQLEGGPRWRGAQRFNGFAGEVDPSSGRLRWTARLPVDSSRAAVAPDGRLWVAGTFEQPVRAGGRTLRPSGGTDVFVLGLDARGRIADAFSWGTAQPDFPVGVHVFPSGRLGVLTSTWVGSGQRGELHRMIGFDAAGTELWSEQIPHRFLELATGDGGASAMVLVPHDGGALPSTSARTELRGAHRVRLMGYDDHGRATFAHDMRWPGLVMLASAFEAPVLRGEELLVAGSLGELRQPEVMERVESFFVRVPVTPDAVRATSRSVTRTDGGLEVEHSAELMVPRHADPLVPSRDDGPADTMRRAMTSCGCTHARFELWTSASRNQSTNSAMCVDAPQVSSCVVSRLSSHHVQDLVEPGSTARLEMRQQGTVWTLRER